MTRYLAVVRLPIAIVIVNFLVFSEFGLGGFPGKIGDIIFEAIRISAYATGGWLTYRGYNPSLISAAIFGIVLMFIDHVILKGCGFIIYGILGSIAIDVALTAFGGVVVSFMMFVPFAMVITAAGGAAARIVSERQRESKPLP